MVHGPFNYMLHAWFLSCKCDPSHVVMCQSRCRCQTAAAAASPPPHSSCRETPCPRLASASPAARRDGTLPEWQLPLPAITKTLTSAHCHPLIRHTGTVLAPFGSSWQACVSLALPACARRATTAPHATPPVRLQQCAARPRMPLTASAAGPALFRQVQIICTHDLYEFI